MSSTRRLYLDHNATAPLRPEAREAMLAALDATGNASSVHEEGRRARSVIERARGAVARLVGGRSADVRFTSGGTEANCTVLTPELEGPAGPVHASRLFVSAIEHPSVLAGGRFAAEAITQMPVTQDGVIDVAAAAALLQAEREAGGLPLVSVMAANNETGVLQPVAEIAAIVRETGGFLHVDAVQAVGRVEVDIEAWQADMLSVSSHKIGGPQGVGAFVLGSRALRPRALLRGGGQEGRLRAGTENVAGIAGFGAAAEVAKGEIGAKTPISELRDWLERELTHITGDTVVFGAGVPRLPNTICFAVPGLTAETAVIACDLAGAAVSSGAACSSGKVASSHVLQAMAVPENLLRGGLRLSLGWTNTQQDVEQFADIWRNIVARMRPAAAGQAA